MRHWQHVNTMENSVKFSQTFKNRITIESSHSTPEYLPKGNKISNSKYIHTLNFTASLFIMAKIRFPKGPMI